jgi:monovalent cation:H+ antiporter-2, CPA2 family
MENILVQVSIYLIAAVIAVPLATRFGLGSVLGYLLAGVAVGLVPGIGSDAANLQHFAEFGVVMMLFLIGLELEPRALWDMRHRLLGMGGVQVLATTLLVAAIAISFGLTWAEGLAIGMVLTMSSTAIVLQTLGERQVMQSLGGRSAFAVLLTQDIAVIPILALMPLLAAAGSVHSDAAHGSISLVQGLPAWGVALVTLGMVGLVILSGMFLTRPLFRFINQAHLREMYTAVALMIVVVIAFLMTLVGLSPAFGTFLAGVVLANSEFRHELESNIEPFKGLLLGLFFITVGAGIDFGLLMSKPAMIIGITVGVMTLKALILAVLGAAFKLRNRDKLLFALGLSQAGEFGFVLVSLALQDQVFSPEIGQILLLVIALSMLLTPLAFILSDALTRSATPNGATDSHDDIDEQHPVIIAGVGRFGQVVNRLLTSSGFQTTVLDNSLETVNVMRTFGVKSYFGDPTRPDLLHSAGLDQASVLVVALDDPQAALSLIKYARSRRPDIFIVARAHDREQVFRQFQAGADKIVREMFDSSLRAGRYVLEQLGMSEYEAHETERMFYKLDRAAMRDLAEVWDPNLSPSKNKAYVERAKRVNKELETTLMEHFASLGDVTNAPPRPGAPERD